MKKALAITLVFLTVVSVLTVFRVSSESELPSPDLLDGTENICLTYTYAPKVSGGSKHTVESLIPYVGYLGTDGSITDTFMDGYLFLPCVATSDSGGNLHSSTAVASDWIAYIDDLFEKDYNIDALEQAAEIVSQKLGRDVKCKVFLTVIFPYRAAGKNFGSLGDGALDFSVLADRKKAIKWCIDEQVKRFNEAGYNHLELTGFYWLREAITQEANPDQTTLDEQATVRYAVDYTHSLDLKAIWIPYYNAQGWNKWKDYGFDVANLQPNLMFPTSSEIASGSYLETRMPEATQRMLKYGMGMEMEMDGQVFASKYERYQMYLRYGVQTGLMNAVKMYYQEGAPGILYYAAKSDNYYSRLIYDQTYKYAKGTLTLDDIVESGSYDDDGWNWVSRGKSYTASTPYTGDGSLDYMNIDGKELTDGVFGIDSLGSEWHAFHSQYAVNGKFTVTIDLGEKTNGLARFMLEFEEFTSAGIGLPSEVTFYVSDDGKSFTRIGSSSISAQPLLLPRADLTLDQAVSGRYVKAEFSRANYECVFIFCSEFAVGVSKDYKFIRGDINGNGRIDSGDYAILKRTVLGTYTLSPSLKEYADIDKNGKISSIDYALLKRAVLKTYTITD